MNLLSDCVKQVDLFRQCLTCPGSRLFCGTDFKRIYCHWSEQRTRALLCHCQPLMLAMSKPRLSHVHHQLSDNTKETDCSRLVDCPCHLRDTFRNTSCSILLWCSCFMDLVEVCSKVVILNNGNAACYW